MEESEGFEPLRFITVALFSRQITNQLVPPSIILLYTFGPREGNRTPHLCFADTSLADWVPLVLIWRKVEELNFRIPLGDSLVLAEQHITTLSTFRKIF